MKKLFFQILMCFFLASFTCSCSYFSKKTDINDIIKIEVPSREKQKELYGYESYKDACREGDFAAAHNFLDDYWSPEAETYIFTKEIVYLFGTNVPEDKRRVFFLLEETKMIGRDCQGQDGLFIELSSNDFNALIAHINSVNRYNGYCDKIINLSINANQKDLALKAVHLIKAQTTYEYSDWLEEYEIKHNNDAREDAYERINLAFPSEENS